ncbi:iron-containing alcohol dehydrogenase [Chloroflexota bacterium]
MDDSGLSTFLLPTKIYLGINSHEKLNEVITDWGINKLFFLYDEGVKGTEIFKSVENILRQNHVAFAVFNDIEPDPSVQTVEKAYDMYRSIEASALLAVGGGSTMDVAKAVGILATNGGRIHDYEGIDKFVNPPLPLIAMPTTAGTGSEVSGSCVITDTERGLKMSIRNAALNPAKVAILDPTALKSLPATVAAHAAMDAFVHAFESYISLNASPITDAMNLYALELISQNIRPFVSDRSDLDAGFKMLCAANLAGMSFGLTGLGNVHCMARFVGTFFHVSHGLSNAICLPYAAEFNLTANPEKYARVALAMGANVYGLTAREAGGRAIDVIRQLCRDLNIPEKLRDIGGTEDKIPEMARLAVEANYNRWNPRHTTYEDFLDLFRKAC